MKKYDALTGLLDYMEENIDTDHIRNVEKLQYDAIRYEEVDRLPLTVCTSTVEFEQIPREIAFENPEMMLFNEILQSTVHSSYNSVRTKDDSPLMIRSNHGTGIIASMFGCKSSVEKNRPPRVKPISLAEAKKAFAKGVPDVRSGLGQTVINTYLYYHDRLKSYPKCYSTIRFTQPDILRPYDIFRSVIGSEVDSLLSNDPVLAKYMIDIIARTCVDFIREIDLLLTDKMKDAVFAHGLCCGGRVLITADKSTESFSPEMREIFETEPDNYIFDAFSDQGGGSILYRKNTDVRHSKINTSRNVRCVHHCDPDEYNLREEYAYYKQHHVAIVGWGYNRKYKQISDDLKISDDGGPIRTGVTLMCTADNVEQAFAIIKEHRDQAGYK